MTINTTKNKRKKKPLNNRRKARELVMKSIYRGLINNFDLNQIKQDIKEDPDFPLSDETLFLKLLNGVYEDFELLKAEIETYLDRDYDELSPIELAILYCSLYELKFSLDVPYKVVINEAIEITKSFGGTDAVSYTHLRAHET